jgi:hypothetical protein
LSRGTKGQKSLCCPGTTGQKSIHCPGTKGQWDKLKILTRNGSGQDFDILPRDGPGFDSLSRESNGTEGKKSKKITIFEKKFFFDNF